MHSAISLIVSLLGVAGLYLLQQAEFLFAVQIVLYVGGIMVLFLFVIMLVNLDQAAKEKPVQRPVVVALVCVALVGAQVLISSTRPAPLPDRAAAACCPRAPPWAIPKCWRTCCFTKYLLPFEIASILLLVAVVGSVVMAKKRI